MATKTKKAETPETATERTFWLNSDQNADLVKNAKAKGLTLDQAIEAISEAGYVVGDRQVYMTAFVAEWHNFDTNKAVKSFF